MDSDVDGMQDEVAPPFELPVHHGRGGFAAITNVVTYAVLST